MLDTLATIREVHTLSSAGHGPSRTHRGHSQLTPQGTGGLGLTSLLGTHVIREVPLT
jgi:hypothetical protein